MPRRCLAPEPTTDVNRLEQGLLPREVKGEDEMKRLTTLCAAVLLFGAVPVALAQEEGESNLSYGVSAPVVSKYIWRGQVLTNDPVVQPEGWVSAGGFTFDVWSNVDLTDANVDSFRMTETDYTVEYAFTLADVEMAAGYIYYTFPNITGDDTQEVYVSGAFDTLLAPSLTLYWDIDEVGGLYANAAVGHDIPLNDFSIPENDELAVTLSASVGFGEANFNEFYFGTGSAFVDLVLAAEMPIDLGGGFSLTPSVGYMQVLDSRVRAATAKSDSIFGGVTVTKEF